MHDQLVVRRSLIALALLSFAALIGAGGLYLAHRGLDNADKIASVGSFLVALVGLLQLIEPGRRLLIWLRRGPGNHDVPSLIDGIPGAAPPVNPKFTGRAEQLAELTRALKQDGRVAVEGIGGVGKTELVAKYVEMSRGRYKKIWWIRGHNDEVASSDVDAIACTISDAETPRARLAAYFDLLRTERRWLLVIDDVGSETTVAPFLSSSLVGHVVVTSRQRIGLVRASITLSDWDTHEAIEFLRLTLTADESSLDSLAARLFFVPLAISQAANFIQVTGISIQDFLQLFEAQKGKMLAAGRAFNRTDTVATMLHISVKAAESAEPGSTKLLRMCSLYAVGAIPAELPHALGSTRFKGGFGLPSPVAVRFRRRLRDPLSYSKWIESLARQRLISTDAGNIVIHPLVAEIVKSGLTKKQLRELTYFGAVGLVTLISNTSEPEARARLWQTLLPHVVAIGDLARELRPPFAGTNFAARVTWYAWREASLLLSAASRQVYEDHENNEGERLASLSLELAEKCYAPSMAFRGAGAPYSWYAMTKALEACAAYAYRRNDFSLSKSLLIRALKCTHHLHPQGRAAIITGLASTEIRLGDIESASALLEKELSSLRRKLPDSDPALKDLLVLDEEIRGRT
ncbi:hypothetical protein Drose_14085 [Dactylosporangium roseum]|uniref:NB-ARC domain-containing protein n=1 Tax=Dactylosporangium roseum TaxID=47989 RepID=A0ABY5ZAZ5_9ACTN|nr:NB-ARC domain-containing protein [Dactylosporangium roseum]UWZ39260.1 hypothetical protein Drose_14085 [Dactylosporangium roseum]